MQCRYQVYQDSLYRRCKSSYIEYWTTWFPDSINFNNLRHELWENLWYRVLESKKLMKQLTKITKQQELQMTIQNVIFFSKILKSIIEMYNRLLMLYTLLVVLEGYFHWKKTNILLKKKITNASFISWGNPLN